MTREIPRFVLDRRLWLLPLLVWIALVGLSLHHQLTDIRAQALAVSTEGARNMFRMIVMTRAWNAEHGGVYAPVNEKLAPNPYLDHPRRDLQTTDGQRLTMINPAFMTRLIAELAQRQTGTTFHITSLKPIRPGNAPDEWERAALERFEGGDKERVEVVETAVAEGPPVRQLRYMAPLVTAKACLACHEKQGYKEGDIRGGISVTQQFDPVEATMVPVARQSAMVHLAAFLLVALLGGFLLEMLRRRWINLGDTIGALEAAREALEKAREAAEAANVAKSTFLANMSHEIRTPMNAIIGMSHLALRTPLTHAQRNYLQKIQGAGNHLLGVINDILDFSKIEAGKLTLERREFDLDELFDNVAAQLGEKVAGKDLELVINVAADAPRLLVGDALRLSQVLLNLGGNAVKFTATGEVDITVRVVAADGAKVTLEFVVTDTGIGLTEAQIDHLFESFQQADSSITRKFGGTGLGLAISKRMVEMMAGEIGVESEPGRGSCFHFTAAFELGAVSTSRRVPTPDLRGRRMLVVDDNESAREVMTGILRSMTFVVVAVDSGVAALSEIARAAAAGEPYEIVFLDWQMPGLDGIATAQAIRALGLARPPSMIMVTAYGKDDLAAAAVAAGIADVFPKPVTASTLFDSVMNVLGRSAGRGIPALADAGQAGTSRPDLGSIAGARVLLVEDNALNQEVAVALLGEARLRVDVAENGAIALDMLAASDYDIVFMDMQMPVMDGVTATTAIRREARFASLPIVAMTANAMAGDRDRCLEAGMNDHLAKPIDPERLGEMLVRWIRPRSVDACAAEERREERMDGAIVALGDVPGLDAATGLRLARGRAGLYLKLVRRYAGEQRAFAERVRAALAESDWAGAIRLAHTLKGVSGQIGAQTLRTAAEVLERALQEREAPQSLALLTRQIDAMLNTLILAIETRLPPEPRQAEPAMPDAVKLREVTERLAKLLGNADFTVVQLWNAHRDLLQAGLGEHFSRIDEAVQDYDFDVAARALDAAMPVDPAAGN